MNVTTETVNLRVMNLARLRVEKTNRALNPCEDDSLTNNTIECTTYFMGVKRDTVERCCALMAYTLRMRHDLVLLAADGTTTTLTGGPTTSDGLPTLHGLTLLQQQQWALLRRLANFDDYMADCRDFIEKLMRDSEVMMREYTELQEWRKANAEQAAASDRRAATDSAEDGKTGGGNDHADASEPMDVDSDHEHDLAGDGSNGVVPVADNDDDDEFDEEFAAKEFKMFADVTKNMNAVFRSFFATFQRNGKRSRDKLYEMLFASFCLSEREPLRVPTEALSNLEHLFNFLANAIIDSTDFCNSQIEVFFGVGMLFTIFMNLLLTDYHEETEEDGEEEAAATTRSPGNRAVRRARSNIHRYWTRLRLRDPADRESVHFLTDVTTEGYRKAVNELPDELFDKASGMDVYLSREDTLCTLVLQFIGRGFLRIYEWPERRDVKAHLLRHYVCDNLHTLFANVGRCQQPWIRLFKRNRDRSSRVMVKLEALAMLYDEITTNQQTASRNEAPGMTSGAAGSNGDDEDVFSRQTSAKVVINNMDTVRKYNAFKEFQERYNKFMQNDERLTEVWLGLRERFVRQTELNSSVEDTVGAFDEANAVTSFKLWCEAVNAQIFPYNFLMISNDFQTSGQKLSDDRLDQAWQIKCQQHMQSKRFTSSKCAQMLKFFKRLEIKARLTINRQQFKYLFMTVMEDMPFLAKLFKQDLDEMKQELDEEERIAMKDDERFAAGRSY